MLKTLKNTILFSAVILVLIISLSVITFSYHLSKDSLRSLQKEKLLFSAKIMARHLSHEIEERKERLKLIADSREIYIYHKKRQNPELAYYFSRFRQEFPVLGFVDYDGIDEIWVEEGRMMDEYRIVSRDSLLMASLSSPGKVIDAVINDPGAGPVVWFALAIETYFDEPVGVLMGEVPLPNLTGTVLSMDELQVGEKGFPLVVNRSGEIIYHPDRDMVSEKVYFTGVDAKNLISSALSLNAGFGRASLLGHDCFVAYAPVDGEAWSLMMVLPYEEFIAAPNMLRNYMLAFSVVLLLAVGYLAIRFGGRISRSLGRLSEVVRSIARGDFSNKAGVHSVDEMGELGASLDMMSEALRSSRGELESANESLRNLSEHVLSVRDEERRVISYRVHDELGQALATLRLDIESLKKKLPESCKEFKEKLKEMSEFVESTARVAQDITSSLRPLVLDELGIEAAIDWQVKGFEKRTGVKCVVDVAPELPRVDKFVSEVLYRVCQEALTNVVRHARATRVEVSLKSEDGNLLLVVEDNGRGITEKEINAPTSFGLMGMRERLLALGGELKISGEPGKGTILSASVDLAEE